MTKIPSPMRALWLALLALLLATPGAEAWAQSHDDLKKAYAALNRWRADEADRILKPMLKRWPKAKTLLFAMGRTRYYQGRYKEAVGFYRKAAPLKKLEGNSTYQSLMATLRLSAANKEIHSPHFIISYPPGPNAILVPYAIQALEKAYVRLGQVFGYKPPDKIRVQILKSALDLAAMSPLTRADITRTGTIALCKYNRVMLTTPHALLRGYRWLDTLVHEYSHLVINRIAAGVPIWLHEGLARYSERLWRDTKPKALSPYSETLLAKAIRKDKLVPFRRMHPSMAKLPTAEMAALAYAQVYDVIRFFVQSKGEKSLPKVLGLIHNKTKVPDAFAKIVGMPFPHFLAKWRNHLRNRNLREYDNLTPTKKILRGITPAKDKKKKPKRNFWTKPSSKKEKGLRYLKLGEMLRALGRTRAALYEYLKAAKYLKNKRGLHNKIAISYIKLRQYAKAIPYLKNSLKLYPDWVTTYVQLGRAYYGAKQYDKARAAFEEVHEINPFHPTSHRYLITIYKKLKKPKASKRELRIYRMLRRRG